MSRPRYWWDGTIKKAMRMYYRGGLDTGTIQGAAMHIGITKALRATEGMTDGKERIKVIELCYLCGSNNIDFAADMVHTSTRTAQRWIADFVRCVGGLVGYI